MDLATRAQVQELMARLAQGERDAFEPLFRLLSPTVRAFLGSQLASQAAEDAAQEALLKVFARASRFDPSEGDALSWVLGIAAYEVKTIRTRTQRRGEVSEIAESLAIGEDPEADALQRDLEAAAVVVLGTLRASDAATLRDAAHGVRPDIPAATFRKRVERAVRRFRLAWSHRHGTD